jgi:two-component system, chemotaxis family, chemotaxis protein CheY
MKILAVDDSPTMLEILVSTLNDVGHEVLQAENGAAAVKVLSKGAVDIIISDLNMVIMSGFELLKTVRESPNHLGTPFVFLTTEFDDQLKQAARSAGATAWVVKPFNPDSLIHLINKLGPA